MTPPKTNEEAVKGGWRELKRQCEIRKLPFEDVKYLVTSTLSEVVGEWQKEVEEIKKDEEEVACDYADHVNKADLLSSLEQLKKKYE